MAHERRMTQLSVHNCFNFSGIQSDPESTVFRAPEQAT